MENLCELRGAILGWYDGRMRDLPWRGTRDPYRIWVSEIMLQQTRAETVIPYYERFMAAWPDVCALAAADEADVLKCWEGLGYYSRARTLHSAAKRVASELGGAFPADAAGLSALPGVGEYTAGMVASIAYGEPSPAIDGNQIRVLSRLFRMDRPARSRDGMAALRQFADALIERDRPGDFNQALMDLGSAVCRPKSPDCEACPASGFCLARQIGCQSRLPVLPERQAQRVERRGVAIVVSGGHALVAQRPRSGLLGGLWTFPNYLDAMSADAVAEALAESGISVRFAGKFADVEHVFTHLRWVQTGYGYRAVDRPRVDGMRWVDAEGLMGLAVPAAHWVFREMALEMMGEDSPPTTSPRREVRP